MLLKKYQMQENLGLSVSTNKIILQLQDIDDKLIVILSAKYNNYLVSLYISEQLYYQC